jgi:hypothetical protein
MARPKAEIVERLAKMIRHEQSAREIGSIAEAEAFASQVQFLLTKHGLEMSEIEFESEEVEPIGEEWARSHDHDSPIPYESHRVQWQEDLAYAIALNNNCALLVTGSNSVCFVGRPSDRQICLSLFRYFAYLALDLADKTAAEQRAAEREKLKTKLGRYYSGADFRWHMVRYKASFCAGFSHALGLRFHEQRQELEQEAETKAEQSNALIHLRNNREAVANYVADLFKDRKNRKRKSDEAPQQRTNWEAFRLGHQRGSDVALSSGALTAGSQL